MQSVDQPSKAISKLSCILNENKTVNSILLSVARPVAMTKLGTKRVQLRKTNTSLQCGTPAMYLTHSDMIEQRREKENTAAMEKVRKELEKKERVRLRKDAVEAKDREKAQKAAQREQKAKDASRARTAKAAAVASRKRERDAAIALKSPKMRKTRDAKSKNPELHDSQQAALVMTVLHAKET